MLKRAEIVVFAGPNGSGKSTISQRAKIIEPYINADDIKRALNCGDLEAARIAEAQRNRNFDKGVGFTFETVLSTDRNLNLLKRAKEKGYFIRCFYVLTANPDINVARVAVRKARGGHDVPVDKIYSRYEKSLNLLPEALSVCDVCHIYDTTADFSAFRIFKKRKEIYFCWENEFWRRDRIERLTGLNFAELAKQGRLVG